MRTMFQHLTSLPSVFIFVFWYSGPVVALDLKTTDGKLFLDCVVTKAEGDTLAFRHSNGVARIPYEKLPQAIQEKYFPPSKVTEYRKKIGEENAQRPSDASRTKGSPGSPALPKIDPKPSLPATTAEVLPNSASTPAALTKTQQEPPSKLTTTALQHPHQKSQSVASPNTNGASTSIILCAVIVAGLFVGYYVIQAVGKSNRRAKIKTDAEDYLKKVQDTQGLPIVDTNLLLKKGETAVFCEACSLSETQAVRQYQGGFAGFRLAKGIYIGRSRGRSVSSQQWAKLDSGVLTITNKRLVFDGSKADRSVPIEKILSTEVYSDGVEVSAESRQKSMFFGVENPVILSFVIRACSRADGKS